MTKKSFHFSLSIERKRPSAKDVFYLLVYVVCRKVPDCLQQRTKMIKPELEQIKEFLQEAKEKNDKIYQPQSAILKLQEEAEKMREEMLKLQNQVWIFDKGNIIELTLGHQLTVSITKEIVTHFRQKKDVMLIDV
ncbi:hypothetical protein BCR41DRAFT_375519 [Lobosporangium transversale]|uniref:Uncharacterized protein n=1 Tax=Lobosporangium transversale TaxID=64571 RepID=A0A1Y2G6T1_9FUNG|nr:hypothetical protein BCR41DRAFT_375519 [Lobosporangium transversale]ORY98437.1 hypothetical protein BCR41DRAFT_375519 [Lobosporangium transversale]|eukprot:XP_021875808.1 hypothetical protein BCR41DRAFT_375519 [Lobosporangium transversale]